MLLCFRPNYWTSYTTATIIQYTTLHYITCCFFFLIHSSYSIKPIILFLQRFSLSMALSMSPRHHHLSALTAFTFLIFVSAYSSALSHFGRGVDEVVKEERLHEQVLGSQKRLSGPGSSPPTCRSKCGKCLPCKPVHVPIQPGLSMPLEYYPEAWRCKCGNKLFMP